MKEGLDNWSISTPPIGREQIIHCAWDKELNEPLHTDRAAAVAAGFKDIYAPDALIFDTVCNALSQHTQGRRLKRLEINFGAVVYPGTTLRIECRIFGESVLEGKHMLMSSFTVCADTKEIVAEGTAYLAQSVPD